MLTMRHSQQCKSIYYNIGNYDPGTTGFNVQGTNDKTIKRIQIEMQNDPMVVSMKVSDDEEFIACSDDIRPSMIIWKNKKGQRLVWWRKEVEDYFQTFKKYNFTTKWQFDQSFPIVWKQGLFFTVSWNIEQLETSYTDAVFKPKIISCFS